MSVFLLFCSPLAPKLVEIKALPKQGVTGHPSHSTMVFIFICLNKNENYTILLLASSLNNDISAECMVCDRQ